MLIPVAEWLPDLPPLGNPGAIVATNVIPGPSAYEPFPGLQQIAAKAGMGTVKGSTAARDAAGNVYTYVGDASALYVQAANSFTSVTRLVGGAYNVLPDDSWEFASWGNTVIAVDGFNDVPQQISLGAANFVNLTGAPPARHIAVIKDFVVLGNISDSAAQVQRVRWSGINNASAWSVDAATLADFQDLPGDGGWVQKIISGEQGYIFQERAIWRMTFVGSPLIFQFDKLHDGIGAFAAQSVVAYENLVFFLASDGFKMFDGSNITDIGKGKVDRTFLNDLDTTYVGRVKGITFPDKKIVLWAYPGSGNSFGNPNHVMVYSWAYNKWARVDGINIETIEQTVTPGYTLDQLDSVSSSLDALAFSLDSREWTGGALAFAAYIGGILYYFTGTPMNAEVQTGEMTLMKANVDATNGVVVRSKAQVNEVWPIVEGMSPVATVAVGVRNHTTESISFGANMTANAAGFIPMRVTGNFHRFDIRTTGDFDFIQGVDVLFVDGGKR